MSGAGRAIGIVMGRQSDWETMQHAESALDRLNISYETRVVSAHRTPERLYEYARAARSRGLRAIIAVGQAGAINAALFAAAILGLSDTAAEAALDDWRLKQTQGVAERPDRR